jgi:hypothetical protein
LRTGASQVVSGSYSFGQGQDVTVSGINSFGQGSTVTTSGNGSFGQGYVVTTSGNSSFGQGFSVTVSSTSSFGQGNTVTVSGTSSFGQGQSVTASGEYSQAWGLRANAWRYGEYARSSGMFSTTGDAQKSELILRANTTSVTPVVMTSDGGGAGATNWLVLKANETITCKGILTCKKSASTSSVAGFIVTVQATRGTTAASTILNFTAITETIVNPDGVVLAITADTTTGGVTFTVTTPSGNWHSVLGLSLVSVIFA